MKEDVLFLLIHSLSRNERRYFKLFCSKWNPNPNYLMLFDAICSQNKYNEREIKSKFKSHKFVKQLHVTKNYLRRLILKSLRNFHNEQSIQSKIYDHLQNIEVLYNKELYSLCLMEVNSALKIAGKHEKLTSIIELYNWKRKLALRENPQDYKFIKEIVAEQKTRITQLHDLNMYWKIALKVSSGPQERATLNSPESAFIKHISRAETLEAKVLFFHTNYLSHLQSGKSRDAERNLWQLVDFLEGDPDLLREDPAPYVSTVNNLISYLVFQKHYERALQMINRAKSVYQQCKIAYENRSLLRQILRTYNVELEIYRDTGSYEQHESFIKQTEMFVIRNRQKIPVAYLFSFWFQLANIYFKHQDFTTSLHWINQMLNSRAKGVRHDLQKQCRMLNLMVHYEQNNLFVLRYFVDSTRRFLKKSKNIQPFEKVLLLFFSQIGRIPRIEHIEKFEELDENLFPTRSEPLVPADILDYINYKAWIEKKINGNV